MFLKKSGILLLFISIAALAQAPEGIPRDLARGRAQRIQNVRYQLSFTLIPKADSVNGREVLRFVESAAADKDRSAQSEWLDFREGKISALKVNGQSAPATIQNGHVELPAKLLKKGENEVEIDFAAPVAPAGKAITRFEDKDDGSEYIYTLFVPMDADMAFPCFDQPDLKAKFTLSVGTPGDWTVISNTEGMDIVLHGAKRTDFRETKPISTYLFAFAAGPFKKVHDTPGLPGLYVRKSKLDKAEPEAAAVQQITADGIKYLSNYFAQQFPFPKYDMVMIPGFAYGGMEHAGATFLREESILFRTVPTHSARLNRDILLLHELTHQWFGDLVTMRWFDDLWLKEGFAQYMAYHALDALKPDENVWKRFYQAIKPGAYGIDSTQGTTPIYQEITNLKDAKSAYGAIVYSKAPGVIKQLAFVVGEDQFRDGLRLYLREHAYANAEWKDLVHALELSSKKQLGEWADAWIKRRGMPQVDVEWSCDGKKQIDHFVLQQHDVLKEGGIWPISMQVELTYRAKKPYVFPPTLNAERADFAAPARPDAYGIIGRECPEYVFANYQDQAYGRFLIDKGSLGGVRDALLRGDPDVFERTLLWGSLWTSVREAEMDPREFINLALRVLPQEPDESLAGTNITRTISALFYYVSPEVRGKLGPRMEEMAFDQMLHSPSQDLRIIWYHALLSISETEKARGQIKDLLNGKITVPGVELKPLDRWGMVGALIELNDAEADAYLAAEKKRDTTGDGEKYAYIIEAARPDAKTKSRYFDEYLHNTSRPEDWIEGSLSAFNAWNQTDLTFQYLRPALDALPQVKQERKIFFLLSWLNAFIGGQTSEAAQKQVHEFLETASLDRDLKLKILEVVDNLDRTVRIRQRYP